MGFPAHSDDKESACSAGDLGSAPGLGRSLEEGMATQSSILAWRIPWTEQLGGLQSTYSSTLGGSDDKESACSAGDLGSIPGLGRSSRKEMATHSHIIAWRITWTEEPGGLRFRGITKSRTRLIN